MRVMLLHIDEETILDLVTLISGENGEKIVRFLLKKPGITDEELSQLTHLDIKEVRKILHKLNESGILYYDLAREKDTGHRIFKWYISQEQAIGFILTNMRKILDRLEERLEYEKNHQFYWCGTQGCRKLPFEEAMDHLFKCPTCRKPLQLIDNEQTLRALEEKINEVKRHLEQLSKVKKIEETEKPEAKAPSKQKESSKTTKTKTATTVKK